MTAMNFKLLNSIKFGHLQLWDVKRYLNFTLDKKEGFLDLSEVLKPIKISISHDEVKKQNLQIIAKINFSGNLFLRDFEEIDTYKGNLFLVPVNTIIFSKINARHGCIYYNENKSFVVSSEYPVFQIDGSKVYGKFLHYSLRLDPIKQHLNSKVTGIAKSRLSVEEFLKLPIPIPTIEIQKVLIEKLTKNLAKAQKAENQANGLEKGIENYLLEELGIIIPKEQEKKRGLQIVRAKELSRWSLASYFNEDGFSTNHKFKVESLSQLCYSKSGGTPSKLNENFWNGDIPWVSPKDMKKEYIYDSEDKITPLALENTSVTLFEDNHILIVVRSGILQHTVPVAINRVPVTINQDMKALKLKNDKLSIEFLFLYLRHFQYGILQTVKTSTTVESIDSEKLFNLQIPIPPKEIQNQIVNHITTQKEQIKSLRQQAEKLRKQAKENFEKEIFVTT